MTDKYYEMIMIFLMSLLSYFLGYVRGFDKANEIFKQHFVNPLMDKLKVHCDGDDDQ